MYIGRISIITAICFSVIVSANSQKAIEIFKYGPTTNLRTIYDDQKQVLFVLSELEVFAGLMNGDTVIGFCITDILIDKYKWLGLTSRFLMNRLQIDFQNGAFTALKPYKVEKSEITQGEYKYHKTRYYFRIKKLRKFDRPIRRMIYTDGKAKLSRVVFEISPVEEEHVSLDYFLSSYFIPYEIANLNVLPQSPCSLTVKDSLLDIEFPRVFPNTRNAFCRVKHVEDCDCTD